MEQSIPPIEANVVASDEKAIAVTILPCLSVTHISLPEPTFHTWTLPSWPPKATTFPSRENVIGPSTFSRLLNRQSSFLPIASRSIRTLSSAYATIIFPSDEKHTEEKG